MPIGLLRWCLEYARGATREIGGVFDAVRRGFAHIASSDLLEVVGRVYDFRNRFVAHQKDELTDADLTRHAIAEWCACLVRIWSVRNMTG